MSVGVIVNPVSGRRGRRGGEARVALARRILDACRIDAEVVATRAPGHGAELAAALLAAGADLIVAWGGDGTINEVARGLVFTDTALALVPAGSGNGFARALGVPRGAAAALAHALSHPARRIDAGSLGGRFFVNVAGVGLDAEVAARFGRRGTRRGPIPYLSIALQTGMRYRSLEYVIHLPDDRFTARALIVALANSPQYGNGAIVAPNASVDDGLLDLVVVHDRSLVGRFATAGRLFTRSLHRAPGVEMRRVTHVRIEANVPLRFHADGDPFAGGHHLDGAVQPGALTIRA